MITYKQLDKEFKKKVKVLQKSCEHKRTKWYDHWWAPGHSSGYQVNVCLRCNKELEQSPTTKERERIEKERQEEIKELYRKLNLRYV